MFKIGIIIESMIIMIIFFIMINIKGLNSVIMVLIKFFSLCFWLVVV